MRNDNIYSFLIGLAFGAIPAWYFTKKKCNREKEEEIKSVVDTFHSKNNKKKDKKPETESPEDILAFRRDGQRVDYTRFSKDPPKEEILEAGIPDMPPEKKPYIIPPEDFGWADYEPITLTYYQNGVLTDEDDEPVEDADSVVGTEYPSHFGEYDQDVVYIRNELRKCDYEIVRDERAYGDILENNPYLANRLGMMMDVNDS